MTKQKDSFTKNLFKLDNGYVLEMDYIDFKERVYPLKSKVVLATFWAQHKGHNIIQEVRSLMYIRRDKDRESYQPYIFEIKCKNTSGEKLSDICLEKLIEFAKKEQATEHRFKKVETAKIIHKRVQDYFYDDLYSWLQTPIFNENNINVVSDKYKAYLGMK